MSEASFAPGALLLYRRPLSRWFGEADNVTQNVAALAGSRFPVFPYNTEYGFPRRLRGVRFEAIVLHYSLFGGQPHGYPFSPLFERLLTESPDAYKIAFFQDEHHWCRKRFGFINDYGIDCVFTMLEPDHIEAVYGSYAPGVKEVVSHLPGYVGPELVDAGRRFAKPEGERAIDVGYRGRPTPTYMGRGAMEKTEIGPRFREAAAGAGLRLDIEVDEEHRLYGDDWHRFLGDCVAQLGVEGGGSFVDLEDEVRVAYERIGAELGREPTIEELEAEGTLARWEGTTVPYRGISPRHFEAAALGSCQVLYEGRYSGLMEPMRHYIPLRKDLSNLEEALARLRDPELRTELTANARADLIDSGAHSYERFVTEKFDPVLERAGVAAEASADDREIGERALRRGPPAVAFERTRSALSYHPVLSRALWHLSRPVLGGVRRLRRRRLRR